MPEVQMKAGAKFTTLDQGELDNSLKRFVRDWMVEAARGARPVRIAAQGVADATGSITMGGATTLAGGTLGPEPGFVWAVTRLAVRVDEQPAAFSAYIGHPSALTVVRDVNADQNGYAAFGSHELMVNAGDDLVIRCSSVTPSTGKATVAGAAIEIPQQLLWKWMTG